jgi:deferrochelatase/peroxidase EfeB
MVSFASDRIDPARRNGPKVNLALSYAGLEKLEMGKETLESFPHEFRQGMDHKERAAKLGDTGRSAPDQWEIGSPNGKDGPIHALCMIYQVDEAALEATVGEMVGLLSGWNKVFEQSAALPSTDREPFGFRDGIAKVPIEGWHDGELPGVRPVKAGEFILGYVNEFGSLPPSPAVESDLLSDRFLPEAPGGGRDFGRNGTYLVFRKLRQDVKGFWKFIGQEAKRLTGDDGIKSRKWVAAKMVGRWPNGNSLVNHPHEEGAADTDEAMDDFLYHGKDSEGLMCPVGSHVRRTNPRDGLAPDPQSALDESARHRLLRRGRVYSKEKPIQDHGENGLPRYDEGIFTNPDTIEKYGDEHGLIFIAINASFRRQFEFIQQSWSNNPNFEGLRNNRDPISGNNRDDAQNSNLAKAGHSVPEDSHMRIPACPVSHVTSPLPRFVDTRGGGYFFLPGKSAILYLAALRNPRNAVAGVSRIREAEGAGA